MKLRSFFVGPTPFWRGRERRKWWRRYETIVRRGNTEPIELLMGVNLFFGSLALFNATPDNILPYPRAFAVALLTLSILGFAGLASRNVWVRAPYGFVGFFVRLSMAMLYFTHDPTNPAWVSFATGAISLGWIAVRVTCREVFDYHFKRMVKQGYEYRSENENDE